MKIFIDTNIILDMIEPKRPGSESSAVLFELARKNKIELFLSTQSILDSYYISANLGLQRGELDILTDWILHHLNVRHITSFDIKQALVQNNPDIEDNAQISLAEGEDCDYFVTNDRGILKRGAQDEMIFINPEQIINML